MIEDITKIKNAIHFNIKVKGAKLNDEMIQGVIICSDADIEILRGEKRNELFVYITDRHFPYDLRKEPNIIAINANSALKITKEPLNKVQMRITISPKNS